MVWRRPWLPSSVRSAPPLRHRCSHILWRTTSWVGILRMSCSLASCASVCALPHSYRDTRGSAAIASDTAGWRTVSLRDSSNPAFFFFLRKTLYDCRVAFTISNLLFTFTLIHAPHVVDRLCVVSWSPACPELVDTIVVGPMDMYPQWSDHKFDHFHISHTLDITLYVYYMLFQCPIPSF